MKTTIALAVIVAATAAPAFAADNDISVLAEATGLSERKVQMVIGNRTAFAEYLTSYDLSVRQFQRALGEDAYERLMSGQPVVLPRATLPATAVVVADNALPTP